MKEQIEKFGEIFRFITPILIAFVGWVTISYLSSIDSHFKKVDDKFDIFIETYHVVDKRLDRVETKLFGDAYDFQKHIK